MRRSEILRCISSEVRLSEYGAPELPTRYAVLHKSDLNDRDLQLQQYHHW